MNDNALDSMNDTGRLIKPSLGGGGSFSFHDLAKNGASGSGKSENSRSFSNIPRTANSCNNGTIAMSNVTDGANGRKELMASDFDSKQTEIIKSFLADHCSIIDSDVKNDEDCDAPKSPNLLAPEKLTTDFERVNTNGIFFSFLEVLIFRQTKYRSC